MSIFNRIMVSHYHRVYCLSPPLLALPAILSLLLPILLPLLENYPYVLVRLFRCQVFLFIVVSE